MLFCRATPSEEVRKNKLVHGAPGFAGGGVGDLCECDSNARGRHGELAAARLAVGRPRGASARHLQRRHPRIVSGIHDQPTLDSLPPDLPCPKKKAQWGLAIRWCWLPPPAPLPNAAQPARTPSPSFTYHVSLHFVSIPHTCPEPLDNLDIEPPAPLPRALSSIPFAHSHTADCQ